MTAVAVDGVCHTEVVNIKGKVPLYCIFFHHIWTPHKKIEEEKKTLQWDGAFYCRRQKRDVKDNLNIIMINALNILMRIWKKFMVKAIRATPSSFLKKPNENLCKIWKDEWTFYGTILYKRDISQEKYLWVIYLKSGSNPSITFANVYVTFHEIYCNLPTVLLWLKLW